MLTQQMIDNVENCWHHLKVCASILRDAEMMHEKVMKHHNEQENYLPTTAKMSHEMVCQMWNLTLEAQDSLGWALETLLNNAQAVVDEKKSATIALD